MALRNTAFPLVSGYELSESCCAAARAALDELRRLGIHFPLDVIMKNSVDELARKHARITAVVNGFDGSNKSNTSDLKLFYTLLLTTGAGYLVSSWASPENLGRMLQQTLKKKGSSNKAGCGMGVFEVAPDCAGLTQEMLDGLKAQLFDELKLFKTKKEHFEVRVIDLSYYSRTARHRFLYFKLRYKLKGKLEHYYYPPPRPLGINHGSSRL